MSLPIQKGNNLNLISMNGITVVDICEPIVNCSLPFLLNVVAFSWEKTSLTMRLLTTVKSFVLFISPAVVN